MSPHLTLWLHYVNQSFSHNKGRNPQNSGLWVLTSVDHKAEAVVLITNLLVAVTRTHRWNKSNDSTNHLQAPDLPPERNVASLVHWKRRGKVSGRQMGAQRKVVKLCWVLEKQHKSHSQGGKESLQTANIKQAELAEKVDRLLVASHTVACKFAWKRKDLFPGYCLFHVVRYGCS